ncbi:MAG: hypothetical protein AAF518_28995 [Spirochaetota bacterium]
MNKHGNSNENMNDHHLYEIKYKKTNNTFKYGICGNPLNHDGSSKRANKQVKSFNLAAGWIKFFAVILLTGIKGRKEARRIEREYIRKYAEKYGKRPDGNERE